MSEQPSRYIESPEEIEAGLAQLRNELIERIEPPYRDRFREITELTDAFCRRHMTPLEAEFIVGCRMLAAACCQKGTPIVEGRAKAKTWAAAIAYTVGWVNFLSDPSFEPTMTGEEIADAFGLSVSTMQRRSVEIREGLEIMRLDPNWTLPSRMSENPLIWLVEDENGLVVDIRTLPREQQVEAFEAGMIPYVPDDVGESLTPGLGLAGAGDFFDEFEDDEPDQDDDPVIGRIGPDGPEER